MEIIKRNILKKVYKKRDKNSHKGTYGNLLIIGGNEKYSGAPALEAFGALKSGVDLVEIISIKRAADIIAGFSPDLITIPLKGDYIDKKHIKVILDESKNKTAFIIGGGLGKNPKTKDFITSFLKEINIPGVIDADAIIPAQEYKTSLSNFVFTPHENEFYRLTNIKLSKDLNKKIIEVKNQAKKLNTTILLKGNIDIISDGNQVSINKTGTPYMTVGGTGDVLAGILGSLIAQKNDLFTSACAAAYINGKAGELSNQKVSLTSTDLIKNIEKVVDRF
jgi:ADP-dependent NAD(P)H-hydrate dehydratase / NAD(P)H-hydrate epimerase